MSAGTALVNLLCVRRPSYGGLVYHVLNRAIAKKRIFSDAGDFFAFEEVLAEARARFDMRILCYCVMPNHWHLVLWPTRDGELAPFMQWMTLTHAKRWHAFHGSEGTGHLYQGRYRYFPVETDEHFLTVCRYVERNPVRARLVSRAEDWRHGSLWLRTHDEESADALLTSWPVPRPGNWLGFVNTPQTTAEHAVVAASVAKDRPFGNYDWTIATSERHGMTLELRPRGRPRKNTS